MQKIKYGVDNIFDYLPDNITTVNVILDSYNNNLKEFDEDIEFKVSKLDEKYSLNDDFFDIGNKKVLSIKQVCSEYHLQIL
jgi:hypothetical protein